MAHTRLGDRQDETGSAVTPTRTSAAWAAVVVATALAILLVIFVAENTQSATINFLGAHGHAPTSVTILVAAIVGAVLVLVVGIARILQLRRVAHRRERQGGSPGPAPVAPGGASEADPAAP